jgi:vacuolar-type H+-ATPase subunit I/STV1
MSIFKTILSPFIQFDESGNDQVKKPDTQAPAVSANAPEAKSSAYTDASITTSQNDTGSFEGYFTKILDEANQKNPVFQGIDLKEFIEAKTELDSIPDEGAKIVTAFNVLKKTGLTKEKLLTTGQEYIKIIDQELAGIEGAFAQQYKNDVQLKEQQVQVKTKEIEAINAKLESLRQEISTLSQQVAKSKAQLTQNKTQFVNAGQLKKAEIEAELQKINHYL